MREFAWLDTDESMKVTTSEARDSYLWFDELHPSEQANRIVAREIVKGVKDSSQWVKWLS